MAQEAILVGIVFKNIQKEPVTFVKAMRYSFGFSLKEAVDYKNRIVENGLKTIKIVSKIKPAPVSELYRFCEGINLSEDVIGEKFASLIESLDENGETDFADTIRTIYQLYKKD